MNHWVQQMMTAYTIGSPGFIAVAIASVVAFFLGYIQYVWSVLLVRREGRSPYPIWVHCFYFAHDSTAAIIWGILAVQTHGFWLWKYGCPAFVIWTLFELYNLVKAVTVERVEIWGDRKGKDVTKGQAILSIICQIAAFYCVVNVIRVYMGDTTMYIWSSLTQIVMASAHTFLWERRGERRGTSVALSLSMIFSMGLTFAPFGMYALVLPEAFKNPWCYAAGIFFTCVAVRNFIMVLKFPPKEHTLGQKKPIW